MDQIFAAETKVRKYLEKERKLYAVDLEKTYYMVHRKALWDV